MRVKSPRVNDVVALHRCGVHVYIAIDDGECAVRASSLRRMQVTSKNTSMPADRFDFLIRSRTLAPDAAPWLPSSVDD